MAICKDCGNELKLLERLDGICGACFQKKVDDIHAEAAARVTAAAEAVTQASQIDAATATASLAIELSTETICSDPTARRLGVVSASCIYGAHLGKDVIAMWRDVIGGRVPSAEKLFADARAECLADLKLAATKLGATGIIAVQINHQELAGGGKNMVMVSATGTAIRKD